jgi:hypothetical protein
MAERYLSGDNSTGYGGGVEGPRLGKRLLHNPSALKWREGVMTMGSRARTERRHGTSERVRANMAIGRRTH